MLDLEGPLARSYDALMPQQAAGDQFTWRLRRSPDLVAAELAGELDIAAEPALEAVQRELVAARAARVVVDLRGLDFMDSTGLHWLLALQHELAWSSSLELVRGRDSVHAVLELTDLATRFTFAAPGAHATCSATSTAVRLPMRS
jgi:anti-sigma B factor antagonist